MSTSKISVITGGSRGLGRNTAINLARRGVDILFTYRNRQDEAERLIQGIEQIGQRAAAFRVDTGDIHAFDDFASQIRKQLTDLGSRAIRLTREQRRKRALRSF